MTIFGHFAFAVFLSVSRYKGFKSPALNLPKQGSTLDMFKKIPIFK